MSLPRFTHDCSDPGCCTFAGQTRLGHDVYSTRAGGVVIRHGDDGPDYISYPSMQLAGRLASADLNTADALRLVEQYLSTRLREV